MIETKTPGASRFAWHRARLVYGVAHLRGLPDWPDAMTPAELAALQYPREGAAHEKRKATENKSVMTGLLCEAIEAGQIETTMRRVEKEQFDDATLYKPIPLASDDWFDRGFTRDFERDSSARPVVKKIEEVATIERKAFAAWLRMPGNGFGDGDGEERPSGHILAWLGPEWAASAPDRARRKPPEETMQQRREAVLQQWLAGPGKEYLERGKLTLTGPETWTKLAEIKGELFRTAAAATIEEFFKNQKLIERKPGRKPKYP
jgi:hypothetical protein